MGTGEKGVDIGFTFRVCVCGGGGGGGVCVFNILQTAKIIW